MKTAQLRMAVLAVTPWIAGAAGAALIEFRSNPASITVDGSRADWSSVSPYSPDGVTSGATVDWNQIWVAHNTASSLLYFRYTTHNSPGSWSGQYWRYHLLIDADNNSGTGSTSDGGPISIGADYLLEGHYLYEWTGSWTLIGGWSVDASIPNSSAPQDIEFAIPGSAFGSYWSPTWSFRWVARTQGGTWDYVPDSASSDWNEYSLVPEPATASLLAVGACVVFLRRRMRAA